MQADREKLIDRIRKLRAKGEDAGVTEAEANAFLDAAARMMADHSIADDDLAKAGIGVEPVEKKGAHVSIHKMHPACIALEAIGKLTGTSIGISVTHGRVNGKWREIGSLTISGRQSDREIADYMFDQVRNMIDGAWKVERERRLAPLIRSAKEDRADVGSLLRHPEVREMMRKHGLGIGHKERRSFGFGMARRITQRIASMATRHADSSNALIVWREQRTVTEDKRKPKPVDLDMHSYSQGAAVAKDIDLGQGVCAGQVDVLRIAATSTE